MRAYFLEQAVRRGVSFLMRVLEAVRKQIIPALVLEAGNRGLLMIFKKNPILTFFKSVTSSSNSGPNVTPSIHHPLLGVPLHLATPVPHKGTQH